MQNGSSNPVAKGCQAFHHSPTRIVRWAGFVTLAWLFCPGTAAAEVSFRDKSIDVLIGSEVGGGTDISTRFIGRFLARYLPGNPTMVYRNMPGARGTLALNRLVSPAVKPDGLTWIGGGNAHLDPNGLARPQVRYDPALFRYFGAVSRGGNVVIVRKERLANLTDKSLQPAIVGTLDGLSSWDQMILFAQKGLNWNTKFVLGYRGTQELILAIQRGEIDMVGTSSLPILTQMLGSGQYVGVVQEGAKGASASGEVRSDFDKVPSISSLIADKITDDMAAAFEYWNFARQIDKWYALPPGTPEEIVKAYAAAYEKMLVDPEFLREAHSQFSEEFKGLTAETIQTLAENMTRPGKVVLDYIATMQADNGIHSDASK